MTPMTLGDVLDAVAYLKAYLHGDHDGLQVLTDNGDQGAMLTATVALFAGMLTRSKGDAAKVSDYLDELVAGITAGGLS